MSALTDREWAEIKQAAAWNWNPRQVIDRIIERHECAAVELAEQVAVVES